MKFNERLKQLREEHQLTQQGIADVLEISKSSYVKYERGEREPGFDTLLSLARYYDVTIDFVLGLSDERNIYIHSINKVVSSINRESFYKLFGKYEEPIARMASAHVNALYDLDWGIPLDTFYMSLVVQNHLHDIFGLGNHIFCYETWFNGDKRMKKLIAPPNEDDFKELNRKIRDFRRLIDNYIDLLQSPEFYNPESIGKEYYFENEILEYQAVTDVLDEN